MLRTTIWRDLRWRLLAAALLVAMPVALLVFGVPKGTRDFLHHLDANWFQLPGASAVLLPAALLLGAAGSLVRPRRDVAYLLSLPVSRRRWLALHVEGTLAALVLIVVSIDVAFIAGAWRAGATLPAGTLLLRSLGPLLAAAAWVPPMLALTALVRRSVVAIPAAFVLLSVMRTGRFKLDLPSKPSLGLLPAWDPWAFSDPRAWRGTVPTASMLSAAALALGGTLVALWLLDRFEA